MITTPNMNNNPSYRLALHTLPSAIYTSILIINSIPHRHFDLSSVVRVVSNQPQLSRSFWSCRIMWNPSCRSQCRQIPLIPGQLIPPEYHPTPL